MYILKRKMISINHWYCVLRLPKRLFTFIKICCNRNWILAEKILIFIQKYGNTFHYLSQIVWFIESLGIAHCCQKRNLSFQNKLFQSITALCVKPLRNLALQGFAKMIPSAPIFPLSLSNSLSFASIPIVKIGKNDENFNFQTLNPFSQWRAALTIFSFSRYFLKKSSFFSTKNFKFVGPAVCRPKKHHSNN